MSNNIFDSHNPRNMVGNFQPNFNAPLISRYFHKSRHSDSMNLTSRIIRIFNIVKLFSETLDRKVSVKPGTLHWAMWATIVFVFAIATITLEMQWISSLKIK